MKCYYSTCSELSFFLLSFSLVLLFGSSLLCSFFWDLFWYQSLLQSKMDLPSSTPFRTSSTTNPFFHIEIPLQNQFPIHDTSATQFIHQPLPTIGQLVTIKLDQDDYLLWKNRVECNHRQWSWRTHQWNSPYSILFPRSKTSAYESSISTMTEDESSIDELVLLFVDREYDQ